MENGSTCINEETPEENYKTSLPQTIDFCKAIIRAGQFALLHKLDWADAFRQLGILQKVWTLLGYDWDNHWLIDTRDIYGSRAASLLRDEDNFELLNYIDDHVGAISSTPDSDRIRENWIRDKYIEFLVLCGIDEKEAKRFGLDWRLEICGLVYDTTDMTVGPGLDKKVKVIQSLLAIASLRKLPSDEFESLLGSLSWFSQLIWPGKAFLRRLRMKLTNHKRQFGIAIRILYFDDEEVKDALWWLKYVHKLDRVSMYDVTNTAARPRAYIWTDGATNGSREKGTWNPGLGGYFDGRYFSATVPLRLVDRYVDSSIDYSKEMNIAHFEALAIIVALNTFDQFIPRGTDLIMKCDNTICEGVFENKNSDDIHWLDTRANYLSDALSRFDFDAFEAGICACGNLILFILIVSSVVLLHCISTLCCRATLCCVRLFIVCSVVLFHYFVLFVLCLSDRHKSKVFNSSLWDLFPRYRQGLEKMNDRGIKDSTKDTYWQSMFDFCNTMQRIGFTNDTILTFPTPDILLVFYMIDCAMIRSNSNCWNTIRNKLAAIDHFNKLALTPTSWSDNPALFNLVDHCKKRCSSSIEATALPFVKSHLIRFVHWVTKHLLYLNANWNCRRTKKRSRMFLMIDEELDTVKTHLIFRSVLIGVVMMALTGMRLGEAFHPDKVDRHTYGVRKADIQLFHRKWIDGGSKLVCDNMTKDPSTLHAVRINIQNSKMRNTGQNAFAWIGRSYNQLDPCLMIFDFFHSMGLLAARDPVTFKWKDTSFLLQTGFGKPITTSRARNVFHDMVHSIGFLNAVRLSLPHGLRKGFA
eukprot:977757_1